MANTHFQGFVPYQALAHNLGFSKIECRVYERGEPVKAPDGKKAEHGDEFIVTAPNGRTAHFVTPVEWEVEKPDSLAGVLAEALGGPRYRVKNQREYVMEQLRECQRVLSTGPA